LVGLTRHAETFISLQWHVLVLTLRLAVYTLFGKARSNLDKNFCIPKNMHSRTLMAPDPSPLQKWPMTPPHYQKTELNC